MCVKEEGFKPPDGGYGWVIVTCFIFINSCLLPLTQSFGIIYQSQFVEMNITAAETSFLLHLNNFVMCSLGLISGPLLRKFNFQEVSFMGGLLVCVGILSTTFARSYGALIFTIGIVIGAGQGILLPGMYIAVNSYFKERLTLAISFQVTGASLSNIFMPQVCHYLVGHYGVQGTVLLLAAISFHAIPAIMLLRPLPLINPPKKKKFPDKIICNDKQHVSERLLSPIYQETTYPAAASKQSSRIKEIIKSLDLELFVDRVYVIIVIGMSISFASELNVILMTPFILPELAHFDNKNVATAISVQASADIIGRLLIPILAHRGGVHPKVMYAMALLLASMGRTILALFYEQWLVVYMVCTIIGLSKGIRAVFQSVIIPKYVSREKLAGATGLSMVVNGILSIIIGPLIGLTHDIGNSYIYTLHTATLLSLMCVALWTVDYLIDKASNKKDTVTVYAINTH